MFTIHNWAEALLLLIAVDLAQLLLGSALLALFAHFYAARKHRPTAKD